VNIGFIGQNGGSAGTEARAWCFILSKLDIGNAHCALVTVISRTRTYSIWVLCLYFAIGLAAGAHDSVVCIDANERVKIETVCQPCCGEADGVCRSEEPGDEVEGHANCDGCTDFPAINESLSGRNFGLRLIGGPDVHSPADIKSDEYPAVTSCRIANPKIKGPPASHLNSLSSTVLIC
jgi:hypothetical protein